GRQIQQFYASVLARYRQAFGRPAEVPSDGYHGVDVVNMAEQIKADHGDKFLDMPDAEAVAAIGPITMETVLGQVRGDLELLGVHYDRWYSEKTLHQSGLVERMIASLREHGHVAEREGAIWFLSSALGDERDHVLVRSNGTPTYLAADIAYHFDKLIERK